MKFGAASLGSNNPEAQVLDDTYLNINYNFKKCVIYSFVSKCSEEFVVVIVNLVRYENLKLYGV